MKKIRLYLMNHPKLLKTIYFILTIQMGCFSFPFTEYPRGFLWYKLYLLIVGYFAFAAGFAVIYGENKEGLVYIISLILTGIGMLCRYILEYGEVSNIRNFSKFNIVVVLVKH